MTKEFVKYPIYFDTNVLLDFYSYSEDTIFAIVNTLEKQSVLYDYIIPKRVYEEFISLYRSCRDRKSGRNNLVAYSKKFDDCIKIINQKLDSLPKIDEQYDCATTPLFEEQKKQLESFKEKVDKQINELKYKTIPSFDDDNDLVFNFVEKHKPTSRFTIKEKVDISVWGEQRIKLGLKPGLKDYKEKEGFDKFGDIYIWKEVLDCPTTPSRCFFITNETKDDWWEAKCSNNFDQFLIDEFKELHPNTKLEVFHFSDFCVYMGGHFPVSALEEISALRSKFLEIQKDENIIKLISDNIFNYSFLSVEESLYSEAARGGNIERVDDFEILEIDEDGENKVLNTSINDVENIVIAKCELTVRGTANVSIRYYADAFDYLTIDFKSKIVVSSILAIYYYPDIYLTFDDVYDISCNKTDITNDREFVPDSSYYQ